jgi:SAM-dependent methyltransferase
MAHTRAVLALCAFAACAPRAASPSQSNMFSEAEAYERFMGRWSRLLAPPFVSFAEIQDRDAVLDVGSGTGALSFAVEASAREAHVTGIDPSSAYVSFANRRASSRVVFEVGDAQKLRFPDASYDDAVALLVFNFIPDSARALKELARVVRPGGAISAAVWDYSQDMKMLRLFWDEADALDPVAERLDEKRMPLCRGGELAELWRRQGLENVREEPLDVTLRFTSFDDYWEPFLLGQGPAGAYVMSLTPERREQLRTRLRERLLGSGPDRPIELQARAWAVKGLR